MTPPRSFVFVTFETWLAYHRERRAIDARFPACSPAPDDMSLLDHWENLAQLRNAARMELRQAMRQLASAGYRGTYPVPV